MPTTVPTPTRTTPLSPTRQPDAVPWPQRFTSPDEICPQQRREIASPDGGMRDALAGTTSTTPPSEAESRGQAIERVEHEAREYLEDRARAFAGLQVHCEVRFGSDVGDIIIAAARELSADVIAMGTHG